MTGLEPFKPLLTALALPPVPWLLLMLIGGRLVVWRPRVGMVLLLMSAALIWLSACQGTGHWLQSTLLPAPPPLSDADISGLKPPKAEPAPTTAILVLGGGRIPRAPESGTADLQPASLERLRYAVRLSRQTGLPLAFSGGVGWGQHDDSGLSEAEIAQRIAERDFLRPIKWAETASRDTHENARLSVKQLHAAGVRHIVLVTHAWHMPRALRAFRQEAGESMQVTAAPMGYFVPADRGMLEWLPSSAGFGEVRIVLRELLARGVGY
ncbi:YdcF family protein [Methylibium sp.]|uniref:YdcF family protein n=1 Tax=Methylibium sp. TaxID=2067992 RepID=UPI003BAC1FFC